MYNNTYSVFCSSSYQCRKCESWRAL